MSVLKKKKNQKQTQDSCSLGKSLVGTQALMGPLGSPGLRVPQMLLFRCRVEALLERGVH